MQKINDKFCFTHSTGEDIYLFTLSNIKGTEVCITNYGAIITSLKIPQQGGKINDIVLGFDKPEDYLSEKYLANYPYFGAVIGRYANRIKNGTFSIDGDYIFTGQEQGHLIICMAAIQDLTRRCGNVILSLNKKLLLKYKSADGEEGYPGNLDTTLCFELTDNDELIYEFTASTDKPTAVNLTHHSYFNLNNGCGTIGDHFVKINSSAILEQDDNFVVTGKNIPVANSHYDFRQPKRIDEDWNAADGYDQTFVLDRAVTRDAATGLTFAAEVFCEESKLGMQVYTSEPVVHFYTGKWIPSLHGKNGNKYGSFSGLCFETHKHPNSINIPHFPDTVLRPVNSIIPKQCTGSSAKCPN